MKKLDKFEKEILAEYDKGKLKSTSPSKAKLAKFNKIRWGQALHLTCKL